MRYEVCIHDSVDKKTITCDVECPHKKLKESFTVNNTVDDDKTKLRAILPGIREAILRMGGLQ